MEKENEKLLIIINEFEEWNYKSSDPLLFYKTKYEELINDKKIKDSLFFATGYSVPSVEKINNSEQNSMIAFDKTVSKGKSYINDNEELVIGLNDVSVDGLASFTITIGNKKNLLYSQIKVGTTYEFEKLKITLSETDYITSSAKFHISKIKK